MHLADVTMFFAPNSGGVKTYLLAKQHYLQHCTSIHHTLVVPKTAPSNVNNQFIQYIPSTPLPFSNGYRFPLSQKLWAQALCKLKPDLIEIADPYVPAWAAIHSSQRLAIPLVAFYHSDLLGILNHRLLSLTKPIIEHYLRRLYRHCQLVLAPSQIMANKLQAIGVQNVLIQPLGVDTTVFNPSQRDEGLKKQLKLKQNTHLLVFAGRDSLEKNIAVLLKTMYLLGENYHLLLIGPKKLKSAAKNVTIIPHFVNPRQLARYFASADALIHAGTKETFGLIVIEAMACATPVVAIRAGAIAENVPKNCGLLSNSASPQALAQCVQTLFASNVSQYASNAYNYAHRNFAWPIIMQQLLAHYQQVIAQGV